MADSEGLQSFDFHLELDKQGVYSSLVPDRTAALVLALLYQRERRANEDELSSVVTFSEEDIHDCLRQVEPIRNREQHERYNQLVRNLQAHFLWRDEEREVYRLKEYARDFCRLMYDRLERKFEPTYTKHIFNNLTEDLEKIQQEVDDNPEVFNYWVNHKFDRFRVDISNQVEILYNKVDEMVQKICDEAKLETANLLSILQNAERNVDLLIKDADELEHIFRASTKIRAYLYDLQHKPCSNLFGNNISKVFVFLADTGDQLSWIRQRIRKIKPYIQRLFNVQQREFDIKTEKFLVYLLERSQVAYEHGTKRLQLPKGVEEKALYGERLVFTRLNKQAFLPPKPVQVERPKVSREFRKLQEQSYKQKLAREGEIKAWLETVHQTLEEHAEVTLTDIIYQILASQENGAAMVLEVIQRLISFYSRTPNYHVKLGRAVWKPNYPHHTLCEITIRCQSPIPS